MTTPTLPNVSRPPRGWRTRESYSHGDESYQMACGHYQKMGVYACNDCNLAPLNEWIALREMLITAVEFLEPGTTPERRTFVSKAHALLESLD